MSAPVATGGIWRPTRARSMVPGVQGSVVPGAWLGEWGAAGELGAAVGGAGGVGSWVGRAGRAWGREGKSVGRAREGDRAGWRRADRRDLESAGARSVKGPPGRQRFAPGPATDGRVVRAQHRHRYRRGSPGPRRPGTGRVAGWGGRRVKRGGGAMGDRRGGAMGAAAGGRGGLWGRSVQRATTAAVAQPLRWARSAAVAWPLRWATGAAPCEMGCLGVSVGSDQARCRVTWGALGQQGGGGGL